MYFLIAIFCTFPLQNTAGVDNINRVVSILMGWGYDFKVLLDYDRQGSHEFSVLSKKLCSSLVEDIVFVNGKNPPIREDIKAFSIEMEDLISKKDFSKLVNKIGRDDKKIIAKEFLDKVISGIIIPEQETQEAFKVIFNQLDITVDKDIPIEI